AQARAPQPRRPRPGARPRAARAHDAAGPGVARHAPAPRQRLRGSADLFRRRGGNGAARAVSARRAHAAASGPVAAAGGLGLGVVAPPCGGRVGRLVPGRPARGGGPVTGRSFVIILVDALGWDLAQRRAGFLADLPERRRLDTVLGFSSAALPS